jgi:hypothetical protein
MAVLWPYLSEPVSSVSAYYDTAPITPLAVGLLAMVSIIAFAAGRQRRSEPELVAGAVLILGLFMAAIAVGFALSARVDVLGGSSPLLAYQRWSLAFAACSIPLVALWYARVLRIL